LTRQRDGRARPEICDRLIKATRRCCGGALRAPAAASIIRSGGELCVPMPDLPRIDERLAHDLPG
jgi:hypothetical protein